MLHALDLARSFQAAKTLWQIECAPHGFAKAAFQGTLAALPIVTYEYKDILLRSVRTNKEASDGHQDRGTGT